jgi:O-succinylhomoserine sulfhydrylase
MAQDDSAQEERAIAKEARFKSHTRPRTRLVHAGSRRSQYGEVSEALFLTQGFLYPDATSAEVRFDGGGPEDSFIYARYGNPTVAMFEDRIAAYEGAEAAFATASGMAAMNAAMFAQLQAGDHVVAARALFGSCLYILQDLLPRFRVETTLVDGADLDAWRSAVRPTTKLFFLESPANPTLELIDIAAVADIARRANAILVVDNVFATPVYQKPLRLGAHMVMYSSTKHIDGQGRCLGGVLLGDEETIRGPIETYLKHTGGTMSPFNAWVMLKGLETLELRVGAQTISAARLADIAGEHAAVARTFYPGRADHPQSSLVKSQMSSGGTMLSLDLVGGKSSAFKFLDALEIIGISNNLGDAKSLVTHPATTTHSRLAPELRAALGITEGLVRISVGLEDVADLCADLNRALDAAL